MYATLALILLFILKIRYPRGEPTTNIVYRKYGREVLATYRKLENEHYKVQKLKLDLVFLSTCITYEKVPKFLNFKLYRNDFRNTTRYKSWQTHLLNREITLQRRKLKNVRNNYERIRNNFRNVVSLIDFWFFMSKIQCHTNNLASKVKITHEKKLKDLGVFPIHWNVDCVHNFSNRVLSVREKQLLSLGLDFCIPTYKLNGVSHYLSTENLCNSLIQSHNDGLSSNNTCIDSLTDRIRDHCKDNLKKAKHNSLSSPVISEEDLVTLKELGADDTIVACRITALT